MIKRTLLAVGTIALAVVIAADAVAAAIPLRPALATLAGPSAPFVERRLTVSDPSKALAMNVPRSWESVNLPGRFVRHRFAVGELTTVSSALDQADATWIVVPALNGSRGAVSFRSTNYPNTYLRHQSFRVKQHENDGSELFRNDASFQVRGGLTGQARTFSFEATNVPGHFLRHQNGQLWIANRTAGNSALFANDATFRQSSGSGFRTTDREISLEASNVGGHFLRHRLALGELTAVNPRSNLDRADATWIVRPALSGHVGAVSFESKNYPGTFLRHQAFRVKQHADDGSNSNLFRLDASFFERPGLVGAATKSFEAVNAPGFFIRHQNFQFWISRRDNSDLFRKDASFSERPPQFVAPGDCTAFFRRWRTGIDNDDLMNVCGWVMGLNQYCERRDARPMVSWEGNRRYLACQQNWRESSYLEEFEQLALGTAEQFVAAANAAAPFVSIAVSAIACADGVIFACATLVLDIAQLAGATPPGIARDAVDGADEAGKCADGNIVACAQLGVRGARLAGLEIPGKDAAEVAVNTQKCTQRDFAACVALGLKAADAAGVPVGLGRGEIADALDCASGDTAACASLGERAVAAGTGLPLGGVIGAADNARKCAASDNDACIALGKALVSAA